MALRCRCQSPYQFSLSQLQIQTHKLGLNTIQFPIRVCNEKIGQSLISINLTNPHFPSLPSLRCSSSNSSVTASESNDDSHDRPTIFIKGLSKSTTEERLKKMFSEFGLVKRVKILTDENTGESLGLAYVWYANDRYVELVIKQMNGQFFDGRIIKVSVPKGSTKRQRNAKEYRF